ncbi:hypothetical protein MesoLjLc_50690 [Mesorhizobium sp. L-8-10]|uniref:hypothetical protein n=1 Tax=Mesorhizobium sp. L-8-10 TaxID=2744523 RepID=UPI001925DC5A|nr:hypothetical protein [Mesorhizobium sp. L-8-10]BCH33139.1 hypothetical protein MesoLjLc_50690 [Mesorhizobium sp. L-8-10]
MKVRVCSLMWGTAWERYGRRFAGSFADFWPAGVELVVVADRDLPLRRGRTIRLQWFQGYQEFLLRWGTDSAARGMKPPERAKRDANGYAWRFDAVKWMPQALAPVAALSGMQDGDIFVWFDADTETKKPVPAGWIEDLLAGTDVACLQRPGTHSEIGFYAMRLGPETRAVLRIFADLYINDSVFKLREWHSAFAWDHALATQPQLKVRNLNSTGAKGHVWPLSPLLADYTLHHKGKRKDQ